DDEHFDKIADTFSNSIVEFVDVRDSFKSAYDGGTQVYYKTDHHWTTQGAYIAYTHLGDALGFKPYNKSNYEITEHEGFYGTTYSSSGYWFTKPDTIELWKCNALNDYTVTINDGGKTTESSSLFFTDHLKEDDKYPVYLDGNHPYTCIKNNTIKSDEKLLVIKDSFAHSLVPFLADHYSEIVMIDLRYYKEDVSKLIESEKFDQMLFLYSIDNLATDTNVSWLK
ncbi:MAG: hypothetical protein IKB73_06060, partial [Ruminococcus sp.]|nr:hypothetical protein [Ruminococcus sp.]